MITKIDSISKAKGIERGLVRYHEVTSTFDKTSTWETKLTSINKFKFDGQFLVIEDTYFNLDKLLYFYIKKDYFEFYFQGY